MKPVSVSSAGSSAAARTAPGYDEGVQGGPRDLERPDREAQHEHHQALIFHDVMTSPYATAPAKAVKQAP